jgi:aminopeptidase N
MVSRAFICLALMLVTTPQARPDEDPGPGVSLVLAESRAARIRNLRYDLHFTVPAQLGEPVRGRATLRFDLADATRPLALDFANEASAVTAGTINGQPATPEYRIDHLVIPAARLRKGANEITVEFRSQDAPLNRHAEFLYALFVPARARQAFPCFDQPDLKARYTVSLDIPKAWRALTNGAERSRKEDASRARVTFAETQPIPTYLFTFAAGLFEVEEAKRGARTFRMLHRETDKEKVARNRDAIFDLHAGALDWLETYTGIPYPFGKFEFLLVPSFQFGGMEHPGSIFYNASALLLDPSATQNQKLGRASLIAHETAHMWFGDLVTMRWFNDVWMKEVFANFMAAKIVNPAFPEINHELRFLYSHYPAAYEIDRTAGTNAIRQPLANLTEAGSLYGAIIYQKAPIVMRQLEMMLGEESFREGMREYLKAHAFGNATWTDLIALLDRRTSTDLASWSRAWVEQPGRPTIVTDVKPVETGAVSITLRQEDPDASRKLVWSQQLDVAVAYQRDIVGRRVHFEGPALQLHERTPAPRYVLPNAHGIGYGNFVLDEASRRYLLENLPRLPASPFGGPALIALWEEMVDGRVPVPELMDALMRAVPSQRDELTLQRMLTYIQAAYWRWTPAPDRARLATRLEALLRDGLDAATTPSLKSAWFNALRDTAVTAPTIEWMERVWRQTEVVPGLVLAEPDFITLAQELAVRGVPNAEKILDEQLERTSNPDRKARMAFVRPALSPDVAVRDAFFASLAEAGNRRREAWVLEALGYLHHPLRADTAARHVGPSLEMLREIQRTGDIFFPKRWTDATLSGHNTPGVARTVRAFLDGLPADYPDRLRRIILSSADDLLRMQKPR